MPKLTVPKVTYRLVNEKAGWANVFLLFTYSRGRRLRMGIGEKVKVRQWDKRHQQMRPGGDRAAQVNAKLNKYGKACATVLEDLGPLTPINVFRDEVRKEVAGTRNEIGLQINTLLAWAEYYYNHKLESVKEEKRRNYNRLGQTLRYLRLFVEEVRKGRDIQFREVDNRFAARFRKFMEDPKFDLHHNEVAKVFKGIREYMKAAGPGPGLPGLHNTDGYTSKAFKMKTETAPKFYLTLEEIDKLLALDLSNKPRLERVRDLFVIGCYTGLRWSDYSRIKPENFVETKSGEINLRIKPKKTGQWVTVPIFDKIIPLLDKYGRTMPKISAQKFNEYIKEVGKLAGLTTLVYHNEVRAGTAHPYNFQKWQGLTSHVARRSFATNMVIEGMPRTVVMELTGHKTEGAFNRYICISGEENAEIARRAFERVRKAI
jgi:integrase